MSTSADQPTKKPVRVWCDGCFDMMHYGHANALRQARLLGDILVVGVHSDAEIERHKGPPVMNEKERYEAVRACKWVDEVVEDAPYVTELETLNKYNIDFCVHGEDITTDENGVDCYAKVKAAGRYRTIKRTDGVSTTDLVGRMLLMTKDHLSQDAKNKAAGGRISPHDSSSLSVVQPEESKSPYNAVSNFLPSTRLLSQFAAGSRLPTKDDVVVYIDGAFDLFHVGHAAALRKAKELGTYLIVGIHEDAMVHQFKGANLPIQNLYERVLSVLQCRFADEVITGAPWHITEEVISTLNITWVTRGSTSDYPDIERDPYAVPKRLGKFKEFNSDYNSLTTSGIIERILEHRKKFAERNKKKQEKELKRLQVNGGPEKFFAEV